MRKRKRERFKEGQVVLITALAEPQYGKLISYKDDIEIWTTTLGDFAPEEMRELTKREAGQP